MTSDEPLFAYVDIFLIIDDIPLHPGGIIVSSMQWMASFFFVGGICFGTMDGSLCVLGWCIERGEFERTISRVPNIMPRTAWYKNGIPLTNAALEVQFISAIAHADKRLSLFYTEELIRIRMPFHADLAAGRNTHEGHL